MDPRENHAWRDMEAERENHYRRQMMEIDRMDSRRAMMMYADWGDDISLEEIMK